MFTKKDALYKTQRVLTVLLFGENKVLTSASAAPQMMKIRRISVFLATAKMLIAKLLSGNLELRAGITGENNGSFQGQYDRILASDDTEIDTYSLGIINGEGSVRGHAHLNSLTPSLSLIVYHLA